MIRNIGSGIEAQCRGTCGGWREEKERRNFVKDTMDRRNIVQVSYEPIQSPLQTI